MTPHQIALVREVVGSASAVDADVGRLAVDRFAAQRPEASSLDLCGRLTTLVAGLDRFDLLRNDVAGLAEALDPLHPTSADLHDLGAALDEVLGTVLPAGAYTPDHAEACQLAWLLVTELLRQRPSPERPRRRP